MQNRDSRYYNAITVIIPVYNGEPWIIKCLDSLTAQTFDNYEVIIVDDGSTDDTFGFVSHYAKNVNHRIRLYHQENAGQSAARNKALFFAQGEYIVFLDSDDYLDPDYLQILYNKIHSEHLDCVVCGYKKVHMNGKVLDNILPNPESEYYRTKFTACCSKIYRRDYLERLKIQFPEGKLYEDVPVNWLVMHNSARISPVYYSGYNYVQRPNSSSHAVTLLDKLPIEAYRNTIAVIMTGQQVYQKDILEYSIINFFAYMLFFEFRHAPSEVVKTFTTFVEEIQKKYIRHPLRIAISGLRAKGLTVKQKMAVLFLAFALDLKLVFPLSYGMTRL